MSVLTKALMIMVALASSIGHAQTIPPDLRIGANFVWHIANSRSMSDIYAFKEADLPRDGAFQSQISSAHKALVPLRGSLTPEVDVIKQYYLNRGEQKTVFRVQSNRSGSRFFEVHILGSTRPPRIIGVKELDSDAVVQRLSSRDQLTVSMKH